MQRVAQDAPSQAGTAAGEEQGMLDPNPTLVWAIPQPSPVQGCCGQSPAVLCQHPGCFTQQQGGICPPGMGAVGWRGEGGAPYQVPHAQHVLKLLCHGVVLHGHEESVEHDADGDAQVHEGVHHHQLDKLLQLHPRKAAVPDQECVGEFVPPGWAFLVSFFQL